jgi:hypothetical protein
VELQSSNNDVRSDLFSLDCIGMFYKFLKYCVCYVLMLCYNFTTIEQILCHHDLTENDSSMKLQVKQAFLCLVQ